MENQGIDFNLSLKNLTEIPFNKYEQDFTFIVNNEKYKTTRIVADLLSPIIRKMHLVDSTLSEFSIDIKNGSTDYFSEFLNLVDFSPKQLDSERIKQFSEYFYKLGNNEEYIKLQMPLLKPISTENVIDQLLLLLKISESNGNESEKDQRSKSIENYHEKNIKEMISFISAHFYELDHKKIQRLPPSLISEILNQDEIKIESEDSLLNLIIEMYEKDEGCSELFEKVCFTNVSENVLEKFIDIFSIDDLNHNIWKSICARLFSSKKTKAKQNARYQLKYDDMEFTIKKGHELEGIMYYLSEKTKGNINDNGTIKITSNSYYSESYHPKNLVDYNNNNYYYSGDDNNIFILFDFKDNLIQLTNYSIKSSSNEQNHYHLKNWVIEVSNDEEEWKEIDSHSYDSTLNDRNVIATFVVKKENDEFYRFVRLRQTGCSWGKYSIDVYTLCFKYIEFFGKLRMKK